MRVNAETFNLMVFLLTTTAVIFLAVHGGRVRLKLRKLSKFQKKLRARYKDVRLKQFRLHWKEKDTDRLRETYVEKIKLLEEKESLYLDIDAPVEETLRKFENVVAFSCHGWECSSDSGKICSQQEKMFCRDVLQKCVQRKCIKAQYRERDAYGKNYFVDFAVIFPDGKKLGIELDGYTYHAYGKIPKKQFDAQLERENQLKLMGWIVLHFSWNQYRKAPNACVETIKRAVSDMKHGLSQVEGGRYL